MKSDLSDYVLVYLSQSNRVKHIEDIKDIKIVKKSLYEDYSMLLKSNAHVIVFISAIDLTPLIENTILSIKFRFNHVSVILHLNEFGLETARKCGELGVDRLIKNIEEELLENLNLMVMDQVCIKMVDFNIDINNYPTIVQNALSIIEDNYIKLMGTREIANIQDISDCTLIREFKKCNILSPKKLLLHFKVKHSLILMMKNGLTVKEIANLCGFSNEKRFNECFQRVFGKSPGVVRENLTEELINAFGSTDVDYTNT